MGKLAKIIKGILIIIVILLVVFIFETIYKGYKTNYFNDFIRAEYHLNISNFYRDNNVKYDKKDSYKITSDIPNDATFYKTIEVLPNTAYKLSCMVKTENVKTEKTPSLAGAHISIIDTMEKSESIIGTNDWQRIELIFNSKNRKTVDVGFRLGGYQDNCTGTAWFSDFKLEMGNVPNDNTWNVGCFVFKNIDVNIDIKGTTQNIQLSMDHDVVYNVKSNIERYKNACEAYSGGNMRVSYDIYEIEEPITSISHDEDNGYYVAGVNVMNLIDSYLDEKEYDHIFAVVKLGDIVKNIEIPVNDWIGLGSMVYRGIGFSNIRLPNDSNSNIYIYNPNTNTFPEEVYVHEFLHDLERIMHEYGYEIPALHDYEKYGYESKRVIGLRDWYKDYMSKNIYEESTGNKIGLDAAVYKLQPVHNSDFKYAMTLDFIDEPENIWEEFLAFMKNIKKNVSLEVNNYKENVQYETFRI